MGQRKLVLVSSRFDEEHEPWAREPNLHPVIELRSDDAYDHWIWRAGTYVAVFASGYLLHVWLS